MPNAETPLLVRALRCEPTARRPLWIMRQAGRYLPEYRALREKHSFEEVCRAPELAAEVTLQPLRRFPLDAAIVFADLVTPLAALGLRFRFDPGPVFENPVRGAADVRALREPDPEEIAPEVAATLALVKPQLPPGTALLGFAGAPWSLAAYMVEGKGKEGFATLRRMAYAEPDLLDELLGKLARLAGAYLVAQHRAGADAVQVFDTWAGLLSLAEWRRLVRPHLLALLERLGAAGVPRILFAHDAAHLLDGLVELPWEALAVDWRVDLPALRRAVGEKRALQGNIDPVALLAGPESARAAARDLLARMPRRGHVVNLGHGILPQTPLASVEALVDTVREDDQR
ncbi:MAG: uroporphyrinogen decarboxylase [Acidobacteria bacterium]|nr:uroporphyrinogen decarboxylase [Acidobacteriota bacterium]